MHWSDLPFLRGVGVESSEFKTYDMLKEDKEVKSIARIEFLEERGREEDSERREGGTIGEQRKGDIFCVYTITRG